MDAADTINNCAPTVPVPAAQVEEPPVEAPSPIVQKSASVDLPKPKEAVQNEVIIVLSYSRYYLFGATKN